MKTIRFLCPATHIQKPMGASACVGRAGGLAFALGIGVAVATGISAGTASADTSGQSKNPGATSPSSATTGSESTSETDSEPGTASARPSSKSGTLSDGPTDSEDGGTDGAPDLTSDSESDGSAPRISEQPKKSKLAEEDARSQIDGKHTDKRGIADRRRSEGSTDGQVGIRRSLAADDVTSANPTTRQRTAPDDATQPRDSRVVDDAPVASDTAQVGAAATPPSTVSIDFGDAENLDVEREVEETSSPLSSTKPVSTTAVVVASLSAVANPFSAPDPTSPASAPAMWTLAAAARRELSTAAQPDLDTSVISSEHTELVTTEPQIFTGQPSLITQIAAAALGTISPFTNALGLDSATIASFFASDRPPFFTTLGLRVERDEFDGMPVWTIAPPSPTDRYVAAIHGGAYVVQPTILHWLDYAAVARSTGATVVVPIYGLAPHSTASVEVPRMADFLTALIDQHGADSVTVYSDSAGGGLALAAAQELVRRGSATPASMVLLSPWLDVSMTNPAIKSVRDPLLSAAKLKQQGAMWAGDLDLTDPMVSPVYGSLEGLPPVYIYSGSRDVLSPDVLVLQNKALASPGAQFTFVLRNGQIHDWALPLLPAPDGLSVRRQILHELTGNSGWFLAGLLPLM